jgi:hypothetical protein
MILKVQLQQYTRIIHVWLNESTFEIVPYAHHFATKQTSAMKAIEGVNVQRQSFGLCTLASCCSR